MKKQKAQNREMRKFPPITSVIFLRPTRLILLSLMLSFILISLSYAQKVDSISYSIVTLDSQKYKINFDCKISLDEQKDFESVKRLFSRDTISFSIISTNTKEKFCVIRYRYSDLFTTGRDAENFAVTVSDKVKELVQNRATMRIQTGK